MTLDELRTEEVAAAQRLMSFDFDGSRANILSLFMIIQELRGIRRTISMVELEQWKNDQCLRHGINVDDYIDLSDGEGIFIR